MILECIQKCIDTVSYVKDTSPRELLYPIHASCDKIINKENNFTRPCGICIRASYYSNIGFSEKNLDTGRFLSRKLGDFTEYMLLSLMEKSGSLVSKGDKFILEEQKISGRIDAIIKYNNEDVGLEIKSISSNKYILSKIFGGFAGSIPYPKVEHILQCMIYQYAFLSTLSKFVICYIRRDNGCIKEFEISLFMEDNDFYPVIDGIVDRSISLNNIFKRYDILSNSIKNSIPPQRDYLTLYSPEYVTQLLDEKAMSYTSYKKWKDEPFGDYECLNCYFKDICDKDSKNEI
jgi:hypothetical protein